MASSTNSPRLKEENNLGDKGGRIVGNARDLASNVADLAKDVATSIGQKAEGAAHAVGSGVQSLGSTVRDRLPHSGVVGTAAASLADGLESGGHYLQEEGFTGIAKDLTNIIRRNPVPAILVGVAAGFLLARVTARR